MLERFKRSRTNERDAGGVATAERPHDAADPAVEEDRGTRRESTTADDRTIADERPARRVSRTGNGFAAAGAATPSALEAVRRRQRDAFGGINLGASFFGWLVAVGVAALLTALLAAADTGIGLTVTEDESITTTDELSVGGAIALLVALAIAYYAGGYVAGRMSRFDGGRQGAVAWLIGVIVTVALALVAVIAGDEYNVADQLNLPALPTGDETFATGGVVALVAIAIGSLLAAVLGGKVGERYHKRVDRAGFID